MANSYYTFTPAFVANTRVRSDPVNAQYAAIEAGFDLLPSPTSITTGQSAVGIESGSGNAYVVTMSPARTVNGEGDAVTFKATHGNTSAITIDVDGIGAVSAVKHDGTALTSGEIVSGSYYGFRFNGAEFTMEVTFDAILQVGYATEWANKAEDSLVSAAAGGDLVDDFSALHHATKAAASAASIGANNLFFAGTHDASTGAPATPAAAAVYHITVAGNFDSIDWIVGDEAFWDGVNWQRMGPTTGTYFRFTATDRVVGSNAGTTQTGDNVFLANANAGDVNLADEVIAIGPDAALLMADADFAGSIIIGARARSGAAGVFTAYPDVVIGRDALASNSNTAGGYNVVIGPRAAAFSPTASTSVMTQNVVIGAEAGERAADNSFSNAVLIGFRAGRCSTVNGFVNPNGAVYIGALAGQNQTSGTNNTAVGADAMSLGASITGSDNVALGKSAGSNLTSGGDNVLVGASAGTGLGAESDNVLIGQAITPAVASSVFVGNDTSAAGASQDNIVIGFRAGASLTGNSQFVIESTLSSGAGRRSFLYGNTSDGNLALGRANSGAAPINRDFGTNGENVFKIHDTPAAPTTVATAGATMYSDGGALNVKGGIVSDSTLEVANSGDAPRLYMTDLDNAAEEKTWEHVVDSSGSYLLRTTSDLKVAGVNALSITRTAQTSVDAINFFVAGGETAIQALANGAVNLYHNNIRRFTVSSGGSVFVLSDDNVDATARLVQFTHQDTTLKGLVGHNATVDLVLDNRIDSGHVQILARDAGSVARTILNGDPDAITILRGDTDVDIQTGASQSAIYATSGDAVEVYWNTIVELQTQDHDATGNASGAQVKGPDAQFRDIGFNVMPVTNITASLNPVLPEYIGHMIRKTSGIAITVTFDDSTAIPLGATFMLMNVDTEDVTIAPGSTEGLNWMDGSGTIGTGNRTLATAGVVTVWLASAGVWYIWGNGLT